MTGDTDKPSTTRERRSFSRVDFQHGITLESASGQVYEGAFNDISLRGMLFHCDGQPGKGEVLSGTLLIGDVAVRLQGRVVHVHPDGHVALQFQELDLESFSHLRRLVAMNMGDADLIDREFFSSL